MRILVTVVVVIAALPATCFAQKRGFERAGPLTRYDASADEPRTSVRASSPSFVVCACRDGPATTEVACTCQSLRKQLQETWLGEASLADWSPPCQIVLHATRTSYAQAVGPEAARTTGSTLIRCQGGKIAERRIDLLVDDEGQLPALPHELTHVVLADQFVGRQPPRWADEGMAMLADSAGKRALHQRDCRAALRNGTAFRVADLLALKQFTSANQVPAFYGQSLSLTQFLIDRDSPSRFVPFVVLAMEQGYDRALREVYGIEGSGQLDDLWQRYVLSRTASADVVAVSRTRNPR